MTEQDFRKRKWGAYQVVEYHNPRQPNIDGGLGVEVPCMVAKLDFDECLLKLQPFPNDLYEIKDFWARCENVHIVKQPTMQVTK